MNNAAKTLSGEDIHRGKSSEAGTATARGAKLMGQGVNSGGPRMLDFWLSGRYKRYMMT
jgi:hypothetical protein